MSKRELIDAIRERNRTASPEFLSRFGDEDLKAYLERISDGKPTPEKIRATVEAGEALSLA